MTFINSQGLTQDQIHNIYRTEVAASTHYMLLLIKSPYFDMLPVPVSLNDNKGQYDKQYFTRYKKIAEDTKELKEAQDPKNSYQVVPIRLPGFRYAN